MHKSSSIKCGAVAPGNQTIFANVDIGLYAVVHCVTNTTRLMKLYLLVHKHRTAGSMEALNSFSLALCNERSEQITVERMVL